MIRVYIPKDSAALAVGAEAVAKAVGRPTSQVAEETTRTAKRFFSLESTP